MALTPFGRRCSEFEAALAVDLQLRVRVLRCLLNDGVTLRRLLATRRRWYNSWARFLGLQALELCWLRAVRPATYPHLLPECKAIVDAQLTEVRDGIP